MKNLAVTVVSLICLVAAVPRFCAADTLSEAEVDRLCPPRPETAAKFRLTRNNVSQIKTRIEKRITAIGREMAAAAERL